MSEIDFLVKIRDGLALIQDACTERLEKMAPPEAKDLDLTKLPWETKHGVAKGDYEQTSEKASQNCDVWKELKAKVKEHKGFWQNNGYKLWFHQQDETTIDRRKA